MKKILFFSVLSLVLMLPVLSYAQEEVTQSKTAIEKKQAVYFYADWCPHCREVNEFFTEKGFYDKYDIIKLNYDERENKIILADIFQAKGYKGSGIPTIIIDSELISGDTPIIEDFERKMERSEGTSAEFVNSFIKSGKKIGEPEKEREKISLPVSLPVLFGAAIVDAINPCAFAVLIILMATVLKAGGKRRAMASGLLFTSAIFISYLLMGLGVYKAITFFNASFYISLVVGILAVLLGLANLKDYFWYGKVFIMEVPQSWRSNMKAVITRVTSPTGSFAAGILVSLFLLPCTSGPYVVILGLLAQKAQLEVVIPLLILYNLIFILPMVVITIAVSYFGTKIRKLEEIREKNLRLLHAIAGVIMLAIGIYLLNGIL